MNIERLISGLIQTGKEQAEKLSIPPVADGELRLKIDEIHNGTTTIEKDLMGSAQTFVNLWRRVEIARLQYLKQNNPDSGATPCVLKNGQCKPSCDKDKFELQSDLAGCSRPNVCCVKAEQ